MQFFKLFLAFIILIYLLTFLGCGENTNSRCTKNTLGEATSVMSSDANATMAPSPSTLKKITQNILSIVKVDVETENQKEATTFTKETSYCDISGVKEFEHQGDFNTIIKKEKFDNCKNSLHRQNGQIIVYYKQMSSEGKYPQKLRFTIEEDYSFNDILLKKGTIIESQVSYKSDKTMNSIDIKVNGFVTYQYGTYQLINDQESIKL